MLAETPLPSGVKQITSLGGMTEYQLDNGLQVLLVPDQSRPTVTINLTVFVGSRHEGYGEAGMAHLLEHMVFKGTPTHPTIPKALQSRGARFNGTTWLDRTNYYETLPANSDNLEFAIKLEADRMVNSFIKAEDLASEFSVVRSEFEQGENNPSRILLQRMMSAAYEWHNYGKSTIGNRSDIERVPADTLKVFYKKFYQPDNALLVVAGKFDPEEALKYTQKYFGAIPRPERKLDPTYTVEPDQDGERTVILKRVGDVALVGLVFHIPSGPHPDFAAVEVLENLLTSSPSGLLYKALVETKKAASVSGSAFALHDPGVMRIMAEVSPGNDPQVVLDTMLDTIEKVAANGAAEKDVERSKIQLIKYRELEAAETSTLAIELSEYAAQGDWRLYFLHQDRVQHVTAEDVKRVAQAYLERSNMTVGLFIPTEKPSRVEVPVTPPLSEMLADFKHTEDQEIGEEFDVSPANIEARTERVELLPGVQAALLSKKTKARAVHIRMAIRYGSAETLAPYATAAEFLPELMTRGTKKLSRAEVQDELDILRTELSASGTPGVAIFSLQTRRDKLADVLELLRQILREPRLAEEDLEVLKNKQLTDLEQALTEPRSLAARTVQRQLAPFPPNDVRYYPTIPEEIERIKALSAEQLQTLYQEFLGGQAVQLSVVGDFDPSAIKPELKKLFADWKAQHSYARIEREGIKDWSAGQQVIETPDKANAVYYSGISLRIKDSDPSYPAMVMGDYILGAGALSSRLGDRIRQREGLSYGVVSNFSADPLDERGAFVVMAICNPLNIKKVETAVVEEINHLLEGGPTDEELERAIQGYIQRLDVSRSDDGNLAQILNTTLYTGRTMKYYSELESKLMHLKPANVTQALKLYVDAKKLFVVEAGDFSKNAAEPPKAETEKK